VTRIVVGVDPSPSGGAALEWALREAVSTNASLLAVRAWTHTAYAAEAYAYSSTTFDGAESATAQREAEEQLKLVTERVAGSDTVDCTASAVFGTPSQVLLEQGEDSAMIVVGSRGHGALSRAVLGSVSAAVLHHATGPVTVVPEPGDSDGRDPRVLVGVDHSPAALSALAVGAEHARRRGATLVPVYVHEPMEVPRGGAHPPDITLLEDSERHQLEAAAKAAGADAVDAQVLVGSTVVQLLTAAAPQDLLVLGSRGRGGFAGLLLGSTSTQVAQHAPCPVLVVRA
jgi:nucleotide-binding universal stress UspA family protein